MTKRLSYHHVGGTTPLLGGTTEAVLADVVSRFGDREAIVSVAQRRRLTYRQLDAEVQRLAKGLIGAGVCRGDQVGIWSTDNVEWVLVHLAASRVGAVLVNVNPAYRTAELRHALDLAEVDLLFLEPSFRTSDYVGMLCQLCPELTDARAGERLSCAALPELRRAVVFDPAAPAGTARPAPGFTTWPELLAAGEAVEDADVAARAAEVDRDDPANIQFTSGTTGAPKAVVLTHHSIVNNGYFVAELMGFTEHDRLCVPVPLYHCFGTVVSTLACVTHGACMVLPSAHFEAGATLHAIEAERCTAVHGVPTMFIAELEELDRGSFDLSSLRTGIMAGAPCPPQVVRRVMEDLHCPEILIGYGQTEAAPVTHGTRPDDSFERRVETVGTNLPHQEVKIVDPETGVTLPVGRPGEACFRGYHVMRGYYRHEAATREAIDVAGWLHSGDLAVMDADGYVRITGRLKDMIIRGGENVYPAEIEAVYHDHPDVADVAVFGVPHARMGEEVGAWFVLREGARTVGDGLRAFARERLAHFKVPRHAWLVDAFPMTVTGKVQKFRMREIAAGWLAEGDEGSDRREPDP